MIASYGRLVIVVIEMVRGVRVRSRKGERGGVLMDCAVKRFVLMFESLRRCDTQWRTGG